MHKGSAFGQKNNNSFYTFFAFFILFTPLRGVVVVVGSVVFLWKKTNEKIKKGGKYNQTRVPFLGKEHRGGREGRNLLFLSFRRDVYSNFVYAQIITRLCTRAYIIYEEVEFFFKKEKRHLTGTRTLFPITGRPRIT